MQFISRNLLLLIVTTGCFSQMGMSRHYFFDANCDDTPAAPAPQSKIFASDKFGFSIEHPSTWEARKSSSDSNAVLLTVESNATSKQVLPSFQVIVAGEKHTLDELAGFVSGAQAYLKKQSPDAIFSASEDVTLDGLKAVRFSYEKVVINSLETQGFRYYAVNNGKVYMIGFFCDPLLYKQLSEGAEKVVKTFKWTK